MNEVIKAICERRSVRSFRPDAVPTEQLREIIKAGTYAASGRGMQSAVIVAVTSKEIRDRLSAMNCRIGGWKEDFDPFYGAPAGLLVLADRSRPTYLYDGSLVMGELMLAAHALGLGSCWIHRAKEEFETPEGRQWLQEWGLTGDYEGIGHCVIGYPAGELPAPAPRREGRVLFVE